jgi:hypothetical protein
LFTVYPGFTQQPIAMSYGSDFIHLVLFMFSVGCTLWALRSPRWFWRLSGISVVSLISSLILTEYYVGLELARPCMIAMVQRSTGPTKASGAPSSVGSVLIPLTAFVDGAFLIFKNAQVI